MDARVPTRDARVMVLTLVVAALGVWAAAVLPLAVAVGRAFEAGGRVDDPTP